MFNRSSAIRLSGALQNLHTPLRENIAGKRLASLLATTQSPSIRRRLRATAIPPPLKRRTTSTMPEKRARSSSPNGKETPSKKKANSTPQKPVSEHLATKILHIDSSNIDKSQLELAAAALRAGTHPVAFPTETVYGLGAIATSSSAVRGIYTAKGRPSDNPLIVHICDREMLDSMLASLPSEVKNSAYMKRYETLMAKFWPGPLTLLFPKPEGYLASEVTAGLDTVGVRMPSSKLACALIKATGLPVAAPSANSSTKPSPTSAAHVYHDLQGKIEYIVDGGNCQVGVESTVVDGLRDPPLVLRPGGVSIDELRAIKGWEAIQKGYKDSSEIGEAAPRAPGMKYKHYSPKAKVVLCEDGFRTFGDSTPDFGLLIGRTESGERKRVGIIRTKHWEMWLGLDRKYDKVIDRSEEQDEVVAIARDDDVDQIWPNSNGNGNGAAKPLPSNSDARQALVFQEISVDKDSTLEGESYNLIDVFIGPKPEDVANGLFAALREMDKRSADVIYVEGIADDGGMGSAVMNRLRKAATEKLERPVQGIVGSPVQKN